jgi:hypothetical protein
MRKIFCVDHYLYVDDRLKVRGRLFKEVTPTFKMPYSSSDIGNYFCKNGLEDKVIIVDFTDVVGKFFAFSLIMPSKVPIDPANAKQRWIMQIISHSNMY